MTALFKPAGFGTYRVVLEDGTHVGSIECVRLRGEPEDDHYTADEALAMWLKEKKVPPDAKPWDEVRATDAYWRQLVQQALNPT